MSKMIATVFGTGLMRPAPGTWGSGVGVLSALALHYVGGFPALVIGTVAVFFAGWWSTAAYTRGSDNHDPSRGRD